MSRGATTAARGFTLIEVVVAVVVAAVLAGVLVSFFFSALGGIARLSSSAGGEEALESLRDRLRRGLREAGTPAAAFRLERGAGGGCELSVVSVEGGDEWYEVRCSRFRRTEADRLVEEVRWLTEPWEPPRTNVLLSGCTGWSVRVCGREGVWTDEWDGAALGWPRGAQVRIWRRGSRRPAVLRLWLPVGEEWGVGAVTGTEADLRPEGSAR